MSKKPVSHWYFVNDDDIKDLPTAWTVKSVPCALSTPVKIVVTLLKVRAVYTSFHSVIFEDNIMRYILKDACIDIMYSFKLYHG